MELVATLRGWLTRFFGWWTGELAGCLPERLRGLLGGNGRQLRVTIAGDSAVFEQVKGKAVQPLGTLDMMRPGLPGADGRGGGAKRGLNRPVAKSGVTDVTHDGRHGPDVVRDLLGQIGIAVND